MQKLLTPHGYIAYRTTTAEIQSIGGLGVCDECGEHHPEGGYLVPVLNHWMCEKCFNEWESDARYYPEDIPVQNRRAAYYESLIPCTAFSI